MVRAFARLAVLWVASLSTIQALGKAKTVTFTGVAVFSKAELEPLKNLSTARLIERWGKENRFRVIVLPGSKRWEEYFAREGKAFESTGSLQAFFIGDACLLMAEGFEDLVKLSPPPVMVIKAGAPREVAIHEYLHYLTQEKYLARKAKPLSTYLCESIALQTQLDTLKADAEKRFQESGKTEDLPTKFSYELYQLDIRLRRAANVLNRLQYQTGEELDLFHAQCENKKLLGDGSCSQQFLLDALGTRENASEVYRAAVSEYRFACTNLLNIEHPNLKEAKKTCDEVGQLARRLGATFDAYRKLAW